MYLCILCIYATYFLKTLILVCLLNRPEYSYLVDLKAEFLVMALTATATPYIQHKMLQDPLIEASSINRPNITFHAVKLAKLCKHGVFCL